MLPFLRQQIYAANVRLCVSEYADLPPSLTTLPAPHLTSEATRRFHGILNGQDWRHRYEAFLFVSFFFFFLIHTITKCTHSGSLCSYSFKANVTFTRFFFYYYITNIIIRLCEYKGTSSSVLCGLCDSFDIIHVCYRHWTVKILCEYIKNNFISSCWATFFELK